MKGFIGVSQILGCSTIKPQLKSIIPFELKKILLY